MSFGSAKPKPAPEAPVEPEVVDTTTEKPGLMEDIKQDGFFTGIADYVTDQFSSHKDQVSMVEQHKIEAGNKAAEEAVIRQEIADGVVNEETTEKPGIMEDMRHDGFFGGVADWVKDSLPGHSDKPAAMYHQEFGEAPPPEAMEEIQRTIAEEYKPSNVRPIRPLTQGTIISETKVTTDELVAQGRFFQLPPVKMPAVTEVRALPTPMMTPVATIAAPATVLPTTMTMKPASVTMLGGTRTIPMAPTVVSSPTVIASPTVISTPTITTGSFPLASGSVALAGGTRSFPMAGVTMAKVLN